MHISLIDKEGLETMSAFVLVLIKHPTELNHVFITMRHQPAANYFVRWLRHIWANKYDTRRTLRGIALEVIYNNWNRMYYLIYWS